MASDSSCPSELARRNPEEDYELLQRMGFGAFGDVYKARNMNTNEMTAIKVLRRKTGEDLSAKMQQEIAVMNESRNENIIAYLGSYLHDDRLWICMEYCAGGSMQHVYTHCGPMIEPDIAYVCAQSLKGLQYLHKNGWIHRDIKGANILVNEQGQLKLADFGLSVRLTPTVTNHETFAGSPYWMAQEVAACRDRKKEEIAAGNRKSSYNQKCDIWSLGITAIEFAELQPPIIKHKPTSVVSIMAKKGFKLPQLKVKRQWTRNFHSFVKAALTKNPERRPSANQLLEHSFLKGDFNRSMYGDFLERVHCTHSEYFDSYTMHDLQQE